MDIQPHRSRVGGRPSNGRFAALPLAAGLLLVGVADAPGDAWILGLNPFPPPRSVVVRVSIENRAPDVSKYAGIAFAPVSIRNDAVDPGAYAGIALAPVAVRNTTPPPARFAFAGPVGVVNNASD